MAGNLRLPPAPGASYGLELVRSMCRPVSGLHLDNQRVFIACAMWPGTCTGEDASFGTFRGARG